jgi:hypothetical protein
MGTEMYVLNGKFAERHHEERGNGPYHRIGNTVLHFPAVSSPPLHCQI